MLEKIKKIILPIIIVITIMIGAYTVGDDVESYTYKIDNYTISIENNHSVINIPGYEQGDINNYQLPIKSLKFIYPNGYNISSIHVVYRNEDIINIKEPLISINDSCLYTYENYYNGEHVNYDNGYPILNINIEPIQIINETHLKIYKYATVFVTYNKDEVSRELLSKNTIDVENSKWLETYDEIPLDNTYEGGLCDSSDNIDYVIVTNSNLKDSFEILRSHRENYSNLICKIVLIEDILSCSDYTGVDDAERLREFCKDAYLDWNTQYILLGGDWENNKPDRQIIPCRIFTVDDISYSYDTMPCDLYYSNLDGDWKYNDMWGGGKYGNNDYDSELLIGRIPVWTSEQVNNSVNKIIWYDNCNDEEWLRSPIFCGGSLGWTSTSKQYMEELRLGSSYGDGFEDWNNKNGNILDLSNTYYEADYPTESDTVNAWKDKINANEASIINHLDHGSYTNTLSLGTGSVLTNTKYPIAISGACLSGRYTNYAAGSVSFLGNEHQCSLIILNTGYGWGSSSSTNGATQYLHRFIWDYIFNSPEDEWQLSKALDYARDKITQTLSYKSFAWTYSWYSLQLFGDPAMKLKFDSNNEIELDAGHNYMNYSGTNTTLKDIALDIDIGVDEYVAVLDNTTWYYWIGNFSTDDFNYNVNNGDYIDIYLQTGRWW